MTKRTKKQPLDANIDADITHSPDLYEIGACVVELLARKKVDPKWVTSIVVHPAMDVGWGVAVFWEKGGVSDQEAM